MMKVSIVQPDLEKGNTYPFSFTSSAAALDVGSDLYSIEDPIAVQGTLAYTGDAYRAEGKIRYQSSFLCDRCLKPSQRAENISFRENYRKDSADAEDAVSFSGDFIDLAEMIRETILLAQPMSHICSPDCRGLCLKCGADLNETECGCDRHIIDPRLAALQKILK